jgi:hypothetical protein
LQEEKNLSSAAYNGFILPGAKDFSTWFCQDLAKLFAIKMSKGRNCCAVHVIRNQDHLLLTPRLPPN